MGSSPDLIYLWCELDPKKQMVAVLNLASVLSLIHNTHYREVVLGFREPVARDMKT